MAAVTITTNVMVMAAPVGDTFSTASIKKLIHTLMRTTFMVMVRVGSVYTLTAVLSLLVV
jgi:hypothetical protein